MSQLVDGMGAVAITVLAAGCSGLAHLQRSSLGSCALLLCAVVLLPFIAVASMILATGVLCCCPVIAAFIVCTWLPSLIQLVGRRVTEARAATQRLWTSRRAQQLRLQTVALARTQPYLVAGVGVAVVSLAPLFMVTFAIAFFWYVLFAPVTLPLTAFVCWRCLSPSKPSEESEANYTEDEFQNVLQEVWRDDLRLQDDLQGDLDVEDDLREGGAAVGGDDLVDGRGGRVSFGAHSDGARFVESFVKRRSGADEIGGGAAELPVLSRERSTAETEAEGLEPTSPPPPELSAERRHVALRGAALQEQGA